MKWAVEKNKMFVRISFGGHLSHQGNPDIPVQQDYVNFNLIFETVLTFHEDIKYMIQSP